jgi:mannitol-1-phosphate 5-dehydrogenase
MKEQAVMLGAGNVGRGFLGQLFCESGYETVFVDIDEALIAALNVRHYYTIRLVDNDWTKDIIVSPVRALHAENTEAVAVALFEASIAATAVGVRALPHIAPLIGAGIALRAETGVESKLNIIICENMKDAAATFRSMVADHMPVDHHAYLQTHVGFVDTVIGRMVPPPTPQMRAQDPSLIAVEPYKELPVDCSAFVGPIPDIVGMLPCGDFAAYATRKLSIHNCGHAILGYLGHLRGHVYGYQALEDTAIRPVLEEALSESKKGIVVAHDVKAAWLEEYITDVLRRLANRALGDTVFRLARDPLRKLGPGDRLVGPARLAEAAGVRPEALSWGIAAGYCFDDPRDPLAASLQRRLATEGLDVVMIDVSDIRPNEPLATMVKERYIELR